MKKRKIISIVIIFLLILISCNFDSELNFNKVEAASERLNITYQTHVQNIGWQSNKDEDEISGTTGQELRLEAIKINNTNTDFSIKYKVHIKNIGWQEWKEDGETAGTTGQALRLEAIQIKLEGTENYSIQYRVHVQNIGWQEWKEDGEIAGTTGQSLRLEAIQIRIIDPQIGVVYQSHVQNIGWQEEWEMNGVTSGTTGEGLRDEAIKIELVNASEDAQITYNTYVQNTGWQGWKEDGEISGTVGKSQIIESIQIQLVNLDNYNVKYRVHIQSIGWTSWKENGQQAGTTGSGLRIEAIEIKIEEETDQILNGIDVSTYQGTINWTDVKNDDIDFAMIRAGFRGWGTGSLNQDAKFTYNAENAAENGIKVGVYFFSQAINNEEALAEANYVLQIIDGYEVTFPVVIDVEYANSEHTGRADNLTKEERTQVCITFCERILEAGYTPMIYADKWFSSNNLDMTQLQNYYFWLAHYTGATRDDPLATPSNYSGEYSMWQYTSSGTVNGISGAVDLNVGYRNFT